MSYQAGSRRTVIVVSPLFHSVGGGDDSGTSRPQTQRSFRMSREPVEKGSRHFVIGKNLIPGAFAQLTSNDNGNLFIQIAHQLKEQQGSSLVDGNEAEFIEDEEIKLDKTSQEA